MARASPAVGAGSTDPDFLMNDCSTSQSNSTTDPETHSAGSPPNKAHSFYGLSRNTRAATTDCIHPWLGDVRVRLWWPSTWRQPVGQRNAPTARQRPADIVKRPALSTLCRRRHSVKNGSEHITSHLLDSCAKRKSSALCVISSPSYGEATLWPRR